MSEKERQREVFIEKRAHALTMILLTRQKDLRIEEVREDFGLDYIVRFQSGGKEGLREFGIVTSGTWAAGTKAQADRLLRTPLQQLKGYGPFPRPVCLFLFTMENDAGWYTWIAEPIEAEDGNPLLRFCYEPDCRQLDNKALKEITERVDLWYDAVFLRMIVNGPGKSKADHKRAKS
jgi:hypothetical protein